VAPVSALLAGAPLSPGDAIAQTMNGSAIISAAPSTFSTAAPASPGALILSGINGFLGVGENGDIPKSMAPGAPVKNEPGTDATSALVPATNCFSGLNAGPVGSLASLGTPLITPAAINPSSIPISTSLLSLGAIAPHQAPSAWGMGAPFAGPLPGGTASTLACALSRQQKETRDLVLKRTGKIFVGGLSQQTSSEDLRNYFSNFGEVKECFIKIDPVTNRGRGFGFVTFSEPDAIDRVMRGGPHLLDEKVVDCKLAVPQNLTEHVPLNAGGKKIFVGGVPTQAKEQDLLRYFGMFGSVEHVMLMQDKETGRHRGFGFVTFEEGNIADLVVHIKYHTLHDRVMEVKEAQPKGALPKPPSVTNTGNGASAAASLLSSASTNGWGFNGNQLSLGLPFGPGSSSSSSSSGASISPPALIGNGLPFSLNGSLFSSSPTGLHDLGSQRTSLPPHPSSPAAYAMHFGTTGGLTQSSSATTWGSSPLTISTNCQTASNNVIGAGRYIPYPTRRPSPGSNSTQMGFNGAAAANAAAAAAHAAAAAAAAASQGVYYSFPQ